MRSVLDLHNQRPNFIPFARQEYLLDSLPPFPKSPEVNGKTYRPLLLCYFVYPLERVHRASVPCFLGAPVYTLEPTASSGPTSLWHGAELVVGEENLGVVRSEVSVEVVFWWSQGIIVGKELGRGYWVFGGPFNGALGWVIWCDRTRFVHSHVHIQVGGKSRCSGDCCMEAS